jgi:SOS-response transcriptional repressor LexA
MIECPNCGHNLMAPHKPKLGLTRRMRDCLNVIKALDAELGHCPSYDEIALRLSLTSKSSVVRLVNSLKARGYLENVGGRRSLTIVQGAYP